MSEQTFEVHTVGVDYVCDDCNNGVMEQTGVMTVADPPQYQHKCSKCGAMRDLWQRYHTVRWERLSV